jgi:hypothetical protein
MEYRLVPMSQQKVTPGAPSTINALVVSEHIFCPVRLAMHSYSISSGVLATITADYFHIQPSWNGLAVVAIFECWHVVSLAFTRNLSSF